MRWSILFVVGALLFVMTAAAWHAARNGTGLPGLLDQPVSVREGSVHGTRGPSFNYFGNTARRHFGGGFRGGK